jgi:hypothetical protein
METFETKDVSETVGVGLVVHHFDHNPTIKNEDIVQDCIPVEQAFGRFQGRSFRSDNVNYSDLLPKKFVSAESEAQSEGSSLLQRFHQLQFEMKQFIQDVHTQKEKNVVSDVDLGVLATQMEMMYSTLVDSSKSLAPPPRVGSSFRDTSIDSSQKILHQIETAKSKNELPITYEIHYSQAVDREAKRNTETFTKFEQRVARLEKAVGPISAANGNLNDKLTKLEQKLKLLNENELRILHAHLALLIQDLERAKSESSLLNRQQASKIDQLHEMLTRSDATSSQLPELVLRLHALRALHERGATTAQQIDSLTEGQQEISALLKEDKELLLLLQQNLRESNAAMDQNIEKLKSRVNECIKRKEEF